MPYLPTAAEMTLLSFLKTQPNGAATRITLEKLYSSPMVFARALEGCIEKRFVSKGTEAEVILLTPQGAQQI